MIILGINAYHGDSSACIVHDGKLLCAIEEERIRRVKHWAGFPSESIMWCLSYAGLTVKNIDYITVNRNPWSRLHKKILRVIKKKPEICYMKERLSNYGKIQSVKTSIAELFNMQEKHIKAKVVNVEHHRAHCASSFFASPFDEAVVLSVDGFGDFLSTMVGIGRNNTIDILDVVEFPYSLGVFYTALTQFIGFWNYGDEYKVMGLSAFGDPVYREAFEKILVKKKNGLFSMDASYFLHDSEGVNMTWLNDAPVIDRLYSEKLVDLIGRPREKDGELEKRFQDIAASLQATYEDILCHILTHFCKKTGIKNLALSGGCAQNSLANGKIYRETPFEHIYIPPASHDAGGAIGSALYLWHQMKHMDRDFVMSSPYWGPEYSQNQIESLLQNNNIKYTVYKGDELCERVARDINEGKIVGWFQGRTEWGPRALGNRSILADARRKDMKDILNARIKKREWFRPFAPAIIDEETGKWFEASYPVPFMEKVYCIMCEKRELLPAVCHVDGTGRLQTVSRDANRKFYDLIKTFDRITGVPIVLNTSFNENEPIVNTPQDAIDCFMRVGMDVLVMGNCYITPHM